MSSFIVTDRGALPDEPEAPEEPFQLRLTPTAQH
jgi:hypothetical protein